MPDDTTLGPPGTSTYTVERAPNPDFRPRNSPNQKAAGAIGALLKYAAGAAQSWANSRILQTKMSDPALQSQIARCVAGSGGVLVVIQSYTGHNPAPGFQPSISHVWVGGVGVDFNVVLAHYKAMPNLVLAKGGDYTYSYDYLWITGPVSVPSRVYPKGKLGAFYATM